MDINNDQWFWDQVFPFAVGSYNIKLIMSGNGQKCEITAWPLIVVGVNASSCRDASLFMSFCSPSPALTGGQSVQMTLAKGSKSSGGVAHTKVVWSKHLASQMCRSRTCMCR